MNAGDETSKIAPHGGDARSLAQAAVLVHQGRHAEALAALAGRTYAPPLDVAAELLMAQALAATDVEQCWSTYTSALARYPDHPVLNLRAGVFAYVRGDIERARALLERSWAAAPSAEAGFYLGTLHAGRGEAERAAAYFAQTVAFEGEAGHWRAAAAAALAR